MMEEVIVEITEILTKQISIPAKSREEAERKVSDMYDNQEIELVAEDLKEVRIEAESRLQMNNNKILKRNIR